MTEEELTSYLDRTVQALENMAPGTNWFAVLAPPTAILIAAALAFVLGSRTLNQKKDADARSEWWRRVQWALDASAVPEDDVRYDYGVRMLRVLATSELAGAEEKKLFDAVWQDSGTGMDAEAINQLREDALPFQDGLDDQPVTGDNEGTKEGSHG